MPYELRKLFHSVAWITLLLLFSLARTAEAADRLIASSGLSRDDFRLVELDGAPEGNLRYLLFSKQVDAMLIDEVNKAIETLYPNSGN